VLARHIWWIYLVYGPDLHALCGLKAVDHKDDAIKTIQTDQVTQFFEWLQEGIKKGSLKTNQAKARIHTVDEGVILITPGIFQDFSKT